VAGALTVFALLAADVDIVGWNAHAERHFATRIGLAEPAPPAPLAGAQPRTQRFVIAPRVGEPGIRDATSRAVSDEDLAQARAADVRAGGTGLALLAARCRSVWVVQPTGEVDALALRLAVILSSTLLGPVLDASRGELFGANTGRRRLDALAQRSR
jgi:hypothetical protein